MKYLILRTDGSKEILQRSVPLGLQELQTLVGGHIEALRLTQKSTVTLMLHEERRLMNLPSNPHCPGILGNAVLGKMEGPSFIGLSDGEIAMLNGEWILPMRGEIPDA